MYHKKNQHAKVWAWIMPSADSKKNSAYIWETKCANIQNFYSVLEISHELVYELCFESAFF